MNNIVLITGATSGFGAACAKRLFSEGYALILVGRRSERLDLLSQEFGNRAYAITLDVGQRNAVETAISQLPKEWQAIDVLINNAGLALGLESAWDCAWSDWEAMVDTNIKGLLHMTQAVLGGMVARNRGYIINIGSTAGSWPYAGGNVYGATKAFVEQFSRNLRCDLAGKKIRVSLIKPGLAQSEFSLVRFHGDAERANKVYEGLEPLQAQDIALLISQLIALPEHINVNELEVMPLCQSWGRLVSTPTS